MAHKLLFRDIFCVVMCCGSRFASGGGTLKSGVPALMFYLRYYTFSYLCADEIYVLLSRHFELMMLLCVKKVFQLKEISISLRLTPSSDIYST